MILSDWVRSSPLRPAARALNARRNRVISVLARPIAVALRHVDRARRKRSKAPEQAGLVDVEPTAVIAVIAHWRSDNAHGDRSRYLERCLDGLLNLNVETVTAVVITNERDATAEAVSAWIRRDDHDVSVILAEDQHSVGDTSDVRRAVVIAGWKRGLLRRHGYYLTWAHVPILQKAAREGRYSHLLYLEDDIRFTDDHLQYWCRYRRQLAACGLLPGFVRYEWLDGHRYLTDAFAHHDLSARPAEAIAAGSASTDLFVGMRSPYQAMYVLDRALVQDHFRFSVSRSPLRSRAIKWMIRERAASGPIFDEVPDGRVSRTVVPVQVNGGSHQLEGSCLIEHMAGNYASNNETALASIRVDDLFSADLTA